MVVKRPDPRVESATMGLKAFPIEGPMKQETYRMAGLTEKERVWRNQWLKDQILSEAEPIVRADVNQHVNPIKRIYRKPLDMLFARFIPKYGYAQVNDWRLFTGRTALFFLSLYGIAYYFKYHTNDWTTNSGWRVLTTAPRVLPGDPGYPRAESDKNLPSDYNSRGFKDSPI